GFYIRMFPHGYRRTTVQIYEPEPIRIGRDDQGRISSISAPNGNSIEISYADTAPFTVSGDANLQGWAFQSVRFVNTGDAAHPGMQREKSWENIGWTWTGAGTGAGQVTASDPYATAETRYASVQQYQAQMEEFNANLSRNQYTPAAADSM